MVPAYQEAVGIASVVEAAARHLPVLVVDDGSTDGTAERAEAAGARVLRQRPNRGKGAALRAGFRFALDEDADAVVALDGDGQHDPDEIPRFLAAFADGRPQLVIGRRDFRRMPPLRRLSNTAGRLALSWAVGRDVPDNQSGYRLIGRDLLVELLDGAEAGFGFEVEMITTAIVRGFGIRWVPIRTIYAGEASHIRPGEHLTEFIRVTRAARRRVRAGR